LLLPPPPLSPPSPLLLTSCAEPWEHAIGAVAGAYAGRALSAFSYAEEEKQREIQILQRIRNQEVIPLPEAAE